MPIWAWIAIGAGLLLAVVLVVVIAARPDDQSF